MLIVLNGRGEPTAKIIFGMLPSFATTCRRATASTLPTMSRMSVGRYFSTCRVQIGLTVTHLNH